MPVKPGLSPLATTLKQNTYSTTNNTITIAVRKTATNRAIIVVPIPEDCLTVNPNNTAQITHSSTPPISRSNTGKIFQTPNNHLETLRAVNRISVKSITARHGWPIKVTDTQATDRWPNPILTHVVRTQETPVNFALNRDGITTWMSARNAPDWSRYRKTDKKSSSTTVIIINAMASTPAICARLRVRSATISPNLPFNTLHGRVPNFVNDMEDSAHKRYHPQPNINRFQRNERKR